MGLSQEADSGARIWVQAVDLQSSPGGNGGEGRQGFRERKAANGSWVNGQVTAVGDWVSVLPKESLEDSIKVLQSCHLPSSLPPTQELGSYNIYIWATNYHLLRDAPRGIIFQYFCLPPHPQRLGSQRKLRGDGGVGGGNDGICMSYSCLTGTCVQTCLGRDVLGNVSNAGIPGYQEQAHRVTVNWITSGTKDGCTWLLRTWWEMVLGEGEREREGGVRGKVKVRKKCCSKC